MRSLAGRVGIEYENLAVSAKHDLVDELLGWCAQHGATERLIEEVERDCTDVNLSMGLGNSGVQKPKPLPTRRKTMEPSGVERQVERLANGMDGLRDEVGGLRADVRVLQADMGTVKRDIGELDRYVKSGAPMNRTTSVVVVLGVALIVMAASMLLLVMLR